MNFQEKYLKLAMIFNHNSINHMRTEHLNFYTQTTNSGYISKTYTFLPPLWTDITFCSAANAYVYDSTLLDILELMNSLHTFYLGLITVSLNFFFFLLQL